MTIIDFLVYKLFLFSWFLVIAVINLAIFGTVAFIRINGQPFHYFFLNLLQTFRKPSLRVWRREVTPDEIKIAITEVKILAPKPIVKKEIGLSRLSELSLIIDTGGAYKGEE